MKIFKLIITPSILLLMLFATGLTDTKAGEEINWQVISSGGSTGSSTNFNLSGTVGQTAVGIGSSASYGLNHGYWQTVGGSQTCCVVRGDALHDNGLVLVNDLVFLVNHVFKGGPPPICPEEGDALADNGLILVNDLVFLVNYVFKGGPAPGPC